MKLGKLPGISSENSENVNDSKTFKEMNMESKKHFRKLNVETKNKPRYLRLQARVEELQDHNKTLKGELNKASHEGKKN